MELRLPSDWTSYFFLLLVIGFNTDGLQAIYRLDDQRSYHTKRGSTSENVALSYGTYRYIPSFQTKSETYGSVLYQAPKKTVKNAMIQEQPDDGNDSKRELAWQMKQKYLEFREKLENSNHDSDPVSASLPINVPPTGAKLDLSNWLRSIVPLYRSSMVKQLRSADEGPSSLRTSGLASPSLPSSQTRIKGDLGMTSFESPLEMILEKRLGASVKPTFDRSILIDFLSLIRLNQQSQRKQGASRTSIEKKNKNDGEIDATIVTIVKKSSSTVQKPRRESISSDFSRNINAVQTFSFEKKPKIIKRGRLGKVKTDVPTNSKGGMAIYISMMNNNSSEFTNKDEFGSKVTDNSNNQFGPFSTGDDPNAGIHPSEVNIPEIDISQLRLPQGVRDSLSKYLKPLIATLKPLRKSVPGLPGLDYPILSVIPYTNFYCTNMPWPGFYADTEARCQPWHACDVDGRQATFLCPNGTIFNQALMVCDWWYNVECLNAPFLYSINERLFINLTTEHVQPYTRITPELLDTIFIQRPN